MTPIIDHSPEPPEYYTTETLGHPTPEAQRYLQALREVYGAADAYIQHAATIEQLQAARDACDEAKRAWEAAADV